MQTKLKNSTACLGNSIRTHARTVLALSDFYTVETENISQLSNKQVFRRVEKVGIKLPSKQDGCQPLTSGLWVPTPPLLPTPGRWWARGKMGGAEMLWNCQFSSQRRAPATPTPCGRSPLPAGCLGRPGGAHLAHQPQAGSGGSRGETGAQISGLSVLFFF